LTAGEFFHVARLAAAAVSGRARRILQQFPQRRAQHLQEQRTVRLRERLLRRLLSVQAGNSPVAVAALALQAGHVMELGPDPGHLRQGAPDKIFKC